MALIVVGIMVSNALIIGNVIMLDVSTVSNVDVILAVDAFLCSPGLPAEYSGCRAHGGTHEFSYFIVDENGPC